MDGLIAVFWVGACGGCCTLWFACWFGLWFDCGFLGVGFVWVFLGVGLVWVGGGWDCVGLGGCLTRNWFGGFVIWYMCSRLLLTVLGDCWRYFSGCGWFLARLVWCIMLIFWVLFSGGLCLVWWIWIWCAASGFWV